MEDRTSQRNHLRNYSIILVLMAHLAPALEQAPTTLKNIEHPSSFRIAHFSAIRSPWETSLNNTNFDRDYGAEHREESKDKTVLHRWSRSLPVVQTPQCKASEDELKRLLKEIKNTLSNAGRPGNNNCELNHNANRCSEMIKAMQCGVNHLKNAYLQAKSNNADTEAYQKLKIAYNELFQKFTRISDDIKRADSQKYQRIIDQLRTDMQVLNEELIVRREDTALVVIYRIKDGNIEGAIEKFRSLDDSKLPEIIKSTYNNYGGLNVLDNVVKFINELTFCRHISAAYSAMYDVMNENNHLYSPKYFIFTEVVSRITGCDEAIGSALKSKILDRVEIIAEAVGNKMIDGGNDNSIYRFAKNYGYVFRLYLDRIIRSSYKNVLWRGKKILLFIDDFGVAEKIITYPLLFELMIKNNGWIGHELVMLAYRVKELDDRNDLTSEQRNKLNGIVNQLKSSGLRPLIWDPWIRIRNKEQGNALGFHQTTRCYSGGVRIDHTCVDRYEIKTCPQHFELFSSKWVVSTPNKGYRYIFTDKDIDRRLTVSGSDNYLWEVTPYSRGGYMYFYLTDVAEGRILDSSKRRSQERKWYEWLTKPLSTDTSEFKCTKPREMNHGIPLDTSLWFIE